MLEINIGGTKLEEVVLLSTQMLTEAILGLDFLTTYGVEISLPERRITRRVNEEVCNFEFTGTRQTSANRFCDLGLMTFHPQTQHPSTAVSVGQYHTKNFATEGVDESVQGRKQETGTRMEESECVLNDNKICEYLINDDNEVSEQQGKRNCAENAVAAKFVDIL